MGKILYSIDNFITASCDIYISSEDDLYHRDNIYLKRPSLPWRSDGSIGSVGNPEWICIDFGEDKDVTYAGIFNHNLTSLSAAGDEFRLKGCTDGCPGQSGACDWDNPDCEIDLSDRIISNFKNSCKKISCAYPSGHDGFQYWRVDFIDQNNTDGYIEVGELFLGQWYRFANARLQPHKLHGPQIYRGTNITHYGQIWSYPYSDAEGFSLAIKNMNDPAQIEDLAQFIRDVHENQGRFVINPNDDFNFCYYVFLENESNFREQISRGPDSEHTQWSLELRTLTQGITLL